MIDVGPFFWLAMWNEQTKFILWHFPFVKTTEIKCKMTTPHQHTWQLSKALRQHDERPFSHVHDFPLSAFSLLWVTFFTCGRTFVIFPWRDSWGHMQMPNNDKESQNFMFDETGSLESNNKILTNFKQFWSILSH